YFAIVKVFGIGQTVVVQIIIQRIVIRVERACGDVRISERNVGHVILGYVGLGKHAASIRGVAVRKPDIILGVGIVIGIEVGVRKCHLVALVAQSGKCAKVP